MRTLFVTGSGTEVGKTVVAALLCRQLAAKGLGVNAVKPVISGYDDDHPEDSDTGILLDAIGRPVTAETIEAVSPWRFRAPLSPDMAARREGRTVPFEDVVAFCNACRAGPGDVLLIEGLGGVMVPLTERLTVLDWMAVLGAPALLVTGSALGTLSHTLTAAHALMARGIALAGVVVSESEENPVPLAETVDTLARFLTPVPVTALPRLGPGTAPPDLTPLVLDTA